MIANKVIHNWAQLVDEVWGPHRSSFACIRSVCGLPAEVLKEGKVSKTCHCRLLVHEMMKQQHAC